MGTGKSYLAYFFVSVVVVEVDSLVVVGSSAEAGVVTLLVEVEVDSFSLLQPANNTKATKPAAIISLFFMLLPYISCIKQFLARSCEPINYLSTICRLFNVMLNRTPQQLLGD